MITVPQVMRQIERSLRAGRVVDVGSRTLRYCRRNDEFSDDQGNHFQALETGVFLQMNVYDASTGFKEPTGKTWCLAIALDDLDALIGKELSEMPQRNLDELSLSLAFTAGLAQIRAENAELKARHTEATPETTDWSPSI